MTHYSHAVDLPNGTTLLTRHMSDYDHKALRRLVRMVDYNRVTACWLWTGSYRGEGYGGFKYHGRMAMAHRVSYSLIRGPVPDGLLLDHLCRVRSCVNPAHLEPVTSRENAIRRFAAAAREEVA